MSFANNLGFDIQTYDNFIAIHQGLNLSTPEKHGFRGNY